MNGRIPLDDFSAGELDPRLRGRSRDAIYTKGVKQAVNMLCDPLGSVISRGGTRVVGMLEDVNPHAISLSPKGLGFDNSIVLHSNYYNYVSLAAIHFGMSLTRPIFSKFTIPESQTDHVFEPDEVTETTMVRLHPERWDLYSRSQDTVTLRLVMPAAIDQNILTYVGILRMVFTEVQTSGTVVKIIVEDTSVEYTLATYTGGTEFFDFLSVIEDLTSCGRSVDALFVDIEFTSSGEEEEVCSIVGFMYDLDSNSELTDTYYDYPNGVVGFWETVGNAREDIPRRWIIDLEDFYPTLVLPVMDPITFGPSSLGSVTFTSLSLTMYPTHGAFFQGRSWWVGWRKDDGTVYPTLIRGSKAYESAAEWYELNTGSNDADGLELFRADGNRNISVVGGAQLILLSEKDVGVIGSDESGPITPSTAIYTPQSSVGAAPLEPINLQHKLIYVATDLKRLISLQYTESTNAWTDSCINFHAYHLFKDKQIKRIEHVIDVFDKIYVLFTDGTCVVGVWNQFLSLYAWQQFDFRRRIADIARYSWNNRDYLIMATYDKVLTSDAVNIFIEVHSSEYEMDHMEDRVVGATWDTITDSIDSMLLAEADESSVVRLMDDSYWDYWSYGAFVGTGVLDYPYLQLGNAGAYYRADGDFKATWIADKRPKYIAVIFLNQATDVTIRIEGETNTLVEETTVNSGDIVPLLRGYDEDLESFHVRGSSAMKIYNVLIADTYEDIQKALQLVWGKTNLDDTICPLPITEAGDGMLFTEEGTPTCIHLGVPIYQKLETLPPKLDTSLGTGQNTIKGITKAIVTVNASGVPYINDVVGKIDADAEITEDVDSRYDKVSGVLQVTGSGYSKQASVIVTQYKPEPLEITEITAEIKQGHGG